MKLNKILGMAMAAAASLAVSGVAHAGAVETINGVTIPVGIVPGGNAIQSGIIDESVITGSGQTLSGIGLVTAIDAAGSALPVWQNGYNNTELAFYFTGYTSNVVNYPRVTFTGGTVDFYTLAANTTISGLGSFAADQAAIQAGTLWLSANGVAEDKAGDTLVSSITTGTSLTNFSAADGNGFLDITGGAASGALATGTFANVYDSVGGPLSLTPGYSDMSLTSDFSYGAGISSDNLPIGGSASLKSNAVPEPGTLILLAVGVLGLALAQRRHWQQ